ncbi:AcrB/AcrD/AcrF family protein [Sphingomonas morindae]|uniref:AcrB/AcrD/AcrF family protein n=1 Tax=Sphingomonas morindae TaxID=1541170 RepID=A0ABY4XB59_9SPHN|nr:AcrB/AcrD/AcrF family protein [Sphingomonas morindae]USI74203.1 AcrB/AcrD/AcrF family protein [Sphingomonas morindae]
MARTLAALADWLDRRWRLAVLLFWIGAAAVLLWQKWAAIHWLALGDTDDNIRFVQVRDWLGGQGWYDLRQYRLNPPQGFNIHWSRLVDLPIAGLVLLARPLLGTLDAWRFAVAVAPLLPMLVAMLALALVVRRLIAPLAYPVALVLLCCAGSAMLMWSPLRIDHHGWQLALLMVTLAGLSDPRPVRAGVLVALSSSLSLAIGLEMLPYIVFAGAAIALRWAWEAEAALRMRAYGLALAGSTGAAFLAFASTDNWAPRCDALTPVWLVTVVLAALLLAGLSLVPARGRVTRLLLVCAAGLVALLAYRLLFPQCWGHRLENIPPEAERLWLSHVREARPITAHPRDVALPAAALPAIGLACGLALLWSAGRRRLLGPWLPGLAFGLFAFALTFWQFRTIASAQMLAVPVVAWACWTLILRLGDRPLWVRGVAGAAIVALLSGGLMTPLEAWLPGKARPRAGKARPDPVRRANRRCPTIPALRPIGRLPKGVVFTFVDAGPRLIALTHHSAVAGPYHRNAGAILDVEHAMRGTPEQAHAIMLAHRADYLLVCPNMSESTIYRSEAPGGFYAKLAGGWTPAWLIPIALPPGNPWRIWRLRP